MYSSKYDYLNYSSLITKFNRKLFRELYLKYYRINSYSLLVLNLNLFLDTILNIFKQQITQFV